MAPTTQWAITRALVPGGPLADLVLGSRSAFLPDGSNVERWVPPATPDLGTVDWRQTLVKSPYVPGAVEVHAVLDIVAAKFTVQIQALDYPTLLTYEAATVVAFTQQSSYTLKWSSSDGGAQNFSCLRAKVAKKWDELFSYSIIDTLAFQFLRQPNQNAY